MSDASSELSHDVPSDGAGRDHRVDGEGDGYGGDGDGPTGDAPEADLLGDADSGEANPAVDLPTSPGVVLWLESGRGVMTLGGGVDSWSDLSPAHNDATTVDIAPLVIDDEPRFNHRPAVRFDPLAERSGSLFIPDSPTLRWSISDFAVFVVVRTTSETLQNLFSKLPPGSAAGISIFIDRGSFAARLSDTQGVTPQTTSVADGRAHLVSFSRTDGELLLSVDGRDAELHTYADLLNISDMWEDIAIGRSDIVSMTTFDGDLGAVVATTGTDGSRLRPKIEAYLMTTYGIAAP
jgi:hypothetical protein